MSAQQALGGRQFRDVFHSTWARDAASIRSGGLSSSNYHPSNYTVAARGDALEFGHAAIDEGTGFSLVHLRIPEDQADSYLHPGLQSDHGVMHALRKKVPARYVHAVEHVPSEDI